MAAFEGGFVFISKYVKPDIPPFIAYSGDHFKRYGALYLRQVRRVGTCIRLRALQSQEIVVPRAA